MNATLGKKLRFADVVYAIDARPRAVRLWLNRGLVKIDSPKPEDGGWTTYSFLDIAILALVRQLVNFGVDVPMASSISNTIMGDHFFPFIRRSQLEGGDVSAGILALPWVNTRIYVFRDGDAWSVHHAVLWRSELGARRDLARALPDRAVQPNDARFEPDSPSGIAQLRTELEPAPVYISIDVETVLRAAFERADESVNDGVDVE